MVSSGNWPSAVVRDRVGGGVGLTHEDCHPDTSEQIPERPGLAGADLSLQGCL